MPETSSPATTTVRDNAAMRRFELEIDGSVAFANYRAVPGALIITHTETPDALRGRGIASRLMDGALRLIEQKGEKVVAGCSFAVDYLAKHPEWQKLEARRE